MFTLFTLTLHLILNMNTVIKCKNKNRILFLDKGYPQMMRLQRRQYRINTLYFLIIRIPCNCKFNSFDVPFIVFCNSSPILVRALLL